MAQITNFFLGANSGSGFQNLFSEIMDPETAFDIMILKGGPGVGKNTFMREIGRNLFYLTALCNVFDISLQDVLQNETEALETLGKFNLA